MLRCFASGPNFQTERSERVSLTCFNTLKAALTSNVKKKVSGDFEFYEVNPKVTLVDYVKSPWFDADTRSEFEKVIPQKENVVLCLLANHEEAANNIYIGMEAFKGIFD